jgi:hypothetical protein
VTDMQDLLQRNNLLLRYIAVVGTLGFLFEVAQAVWHW